MAIVNDIKELKYLFDTTTNDYDLHTYNKQEYTYISDTQSTSNVIMFDNQTIQNMLTTLHDAYLDVPLVIDYASGARTAQTRDISLKVSAAEIFSGFHFTLANSQTIVNEQHALPFINTYRKLNRFNELGLKQKAIEMQYSPDVFPQLEHGTISPHGTSTNSVRKLYNQSTANLSAVTQSAFTVTTASAAAVHVGGTIVFADGRMDYITAVSVGASYTVTKSRTISSQTAVVYFWDPTISSGTVTQNPYFNKGLYDRCIYRKQNTNAQADGISDTSFTVHCLVPLAEVHDIIKQIGFPITNMRMQFRFELAYPMNPSSLFNAWMVAQESAITTGDLSSSSLAVVAPSTIKFITGTARMYVKNITLNPDDNIRLQKELSAGITKNLAFTETRLYTIATARSYPGTPSTDVISSSESNVQRVIIFALPTGAALSYNYSSLPTVRFNRVALKINNMPERTFALGNLQEVPEEPWQLLKEHLHFGGASDTDSSLINYQTYLHNIHNYYVFDFERLGIRPNKANPISLAVELTPFPTDNSIHGTLPAFDLYCLIEGEARIQLSFDTNSTRVIKSYA